MRTKKVKATNWKPAGKRRAYVRRDGDSALESRLKKELRTTLGILFDLFHEEGEKLCLMMARLAHKAQLSDRTILALWYGTTQQPRMMTIQKIAYACGVVLTPTENGVALSLVEA